MRIMRRANPPPRPSARPLAALRAGGLLRLLRSALAGGRRGLRGLLRRLRRQPGHLLRVLGRLKTRARARRQDKTETELP